MPTNDQMASTNPDRLAARNAALRQWLDDAITTCRETIAFYGDAPIASAHWEGRLSAFSDMLFLLDGGDDGNG